MFLQLHDGPEVPYGLKKYPFPKYTGKLMPVSTAENPYAPGAPVMKLSPYAVLAGCDPALVYAQFVPQTKDAWENRLNQVDRAKTLVKNYNTLKDAAGTGSVPIYDSNGVISGFRSGSKAEVAGAWMQLAATAINIAKDGIKAGAANRLKDDAQGLWDQNKWGIADVCTQSLSELNTNATNCYNSLKWWIDDQSKAQAIWLAIPKIFRTNLANPQKAGRVRIANRAVVIRQNALTILVQQIEEKGGKFGPDGGPEGGIGAAAILAALGALAFLRF